MILCPIYKIGAESSYNRRKCRCEICKKAAADHSKKWKAANPEKYKEDTRKYREKNRERIRLSSKRAWNTNNSTVRDQYLKKHFGLSLNEFTRLENVQNYQCAICFGTNGQRRLAVDHNHITGKVRGLLCTRCNNAIGACKDSTVILQSMIKYLQGETR